MDSSRRQLHSRPSSPLGFSLLPPKHSVLSGGLMASPGPIVSGIPKPQVTWFLEGAPVRRREGTVEIYEDGASHYLCLLRARARDSGNYSCTASNVRGQVSCAWTLLVKSEYIPPGHPGLLVRRLHILHKVISHSPPPRVYNPTETSSPHTCQGQSHCPKTVIPDQEVTNITSE